MFHVIEEHKITGEIAEYESIAHMFNNYENAIRHCMNYLSGIRMVNYRYYICEVDK